MGSNHMGMHPRTTAATALLVLLLSLIGLPGGGLAAQDQDNAVFSELLKQTALERSIVLRKLRDYDPSKHLQQGGQQLDDYWRSESMAASFQRHYQDIATLLGQINIDPRFGTLDTLLAQYKSFYDDTGLNEISDVFVRDALRAIQTTHETFIEEILTGFGQYSNGVYESTQRNIGDDLDEIVQKQFEYWPKLTANLARLNVKPGDIQGAKRSEAPMAGFAGALMVILRKQIQNAITKVLGAKLVGKVGLRFVPYVGLVLIA